MATPTRTGQALGARVEQRLTRLERVGGGGNGAGACRPAFSAADAEAHRLVGEWMTAAGLRVELDPAGNLWGRLPGADPSAAEVWTGSHLDSVPRGGRYDGALGVVAGLAAVERIAAGPPPLRTVAVVAFRDEEGCRFDHGFYGSRWLTGTLDPAVAELRDGDGVSLGEARARIGLARHPAPAPLTPPHAFVELHIEQGPRLADLGRPLGVVTSVVGLAERRVVFGGAAGHAGAVPMALRRDPFTALAHFAVGLDAAARAIPDGVATIGHVEVLPGAANVIPDEVRASVDARAPVRADLDALAAAVERLAAEAADRTGAVATVVRRGEIAPATMDPGVTAALTAAVDAHDGTAPMLPSGAGHDAGVLAAAGVPAGMMFVRSGAGGVSHAPEEATSVADIAVATTALEDALRALAAA